MLGEELKNPGRDMPRSIVFGMLTVIVIYVTANVAYLCILPVHGERLGLKVGMEVCVTKAECQPFRKMAFVAYRCILPVHDNRPVQ